MNAAFYKGTRPGLHGVYNRAVRLWTRGPYSHCELVFGDGIAASASLMDGGVRMKRIDFDAAKWDFVPLPWADAARARRWFIDRDGMPYDVLGNLRFVVPPLPDAPLRFFCSEAVLAALGFAEAWRFCPNGAHDILKTLEPQR
jgi:hypothetical protein